MKHRLTSIAIISIMAALVFSGCGCNKTQDVKATNDEAVVEVTTAPNSTLSTLSKTDKAIVDTGLKVDKDGNITDKNGNKLEKSENGKVKVKTEDGKTVEVDVKEVEEANQHQKAVENKNADVAQNNKSDTVQNKKANTDNSGDETKKSDTEAPKPVPQKTDDKPKPTAAPEKTYHEAVYKTIEHPAETKQVKVVDQEAYSYEEPVYETKMIAKCKDCGMDISQLGSQEARDAHAEAHMEAGGDGGWYSTTEQVQVGTQTIAVPEQYHYETVTVKEAWTEKVLVKEAGWY